MSTEAQDTKIDRPPPNVYLTVVVFLKMELKKTSSHDLMGVLDTVFNFN